MSKVSANVYLSDCLQQLSRRVFTIMCSVLTYVMANFTDILILNAMPEWKGRQCLKKWGYHYPFGQ